MTAATISSINPQKLIGLQEVCFGAPCFPSAQKKHMAIQLIKIRQRPDHFHREGQVVCERCMSKLVSSGNPAIDALGEYFYVARQIVFLSVQTAFQFAFDVFRFIVNAPKKIASALFVPTQGSSKAHVHEDGQPVCKECMTRFSSSGSGFVDNIRENIHLVNEILLIVAQFILFASIGIGSLIAAMFPGVTGQKSAYDQQLDSQYRQRKQKDWEALQKAAESGRAYDEKRDQHFEAHHADLRKLKKTRQEWNEALDKVWKKKIQEAASGKEEIDREWKRKVEEAIAQEEAIAKEEAELEEAIAKGEAELEEYEKNRTALNSASLNSPKIFGGNELAEDDHLIKEISNTIKGIESGVEDPEKLRKVSEELMKHRKDTAEKDARRRELLNKYKDKDWEAHRLFSDADKAFGRGDNQAGEGLIRAAQGAQSEANGLYNEFLSV